MSDNTYEQRYAIKFCVKLGVTPTVTFEKLKKTYGDDTLSRAQVFRWYKAFSDGRESVQDDPRSGRPLTSKSDENVRKIKDLVRNDRQLTTRMIAEQLHLNHMTVHQVLKELKMRKKNRKTEKPSKQNGSEVGQKTKRYEKKSTNK